ncbi:MAG: biotin/lipoate A/B protein ligase family protein [Candidatus Bathyarchaeia archaeon]
MRSDLMTETWRLIASESHRPERNLAVEEAVLQAVGLGSSPNTVCFYVNEMSLVLGRFQSALWEADPSTCRKYGIKILRRITGGGAVYHDYGNLNYSYIVKRPHRLLSHDVRSVKRRLQQPVIRVINGLGLHVDFDDRNGLTIRGKRLSGVACALKKGVFLLHGTLLVNAQVGVLTQALNLDRTRMASTQQRGAVSAVKPVTTLSRELRKPISMEEVKKMLKNAIVECFKIKLESGLLTTFEVTLSNKLLKEKYGRPEWNLKM